ncbi:hypothetical protein LTR85_000742 [Meristemomyces frigidus]|nr:hypothetical protein LTR85_000742 [Meristemomyces frigidus]
MANGVNSVLLGQYKYRRLKDDREFRLLTIFGGSGEGDIKCKLEHHTLPSDYILPSDNEAEPEDASSSFPDITTSADIGVAYPDYEAVSWNWGEATDRPDRRLQITTSDEVQFLPVRGRLHEALKQLRKNEEPRVLWVDHVCIDQHNPREIDPQFAMMSDIFSHASRVCIWLGEETENSKLAFDFISTKLSDIDSFDEITTRPKYADRWRALAVLMNRPWFTRRWVVQEISLAKEATLYCGKSSVDWTTFELAVALFERVATTLNLLFRSSATAQYMYDPEFFGDVSTMGASRLVQLKSALFRWSDDKRITDYNFDLGELVANLASFEATEPRDMIYSILSLAPGTTHKTDVRPGVTRANAKTLNGEDVAGDSRSTGTNLKVLKAVATNKPSEAGVFKADYELDFFDVYKKFLTFTMGYPARLNNLDVLCRPWAPRAVEGLPSWILTTRDAPFDHSLGSLRFMRQNSDPLVGLSNSPYSACRLHAEYGEDCYFGKDNMSARSLFVTGFQIDVVAEASYHSYTGHIPQQWYQLAGWDPWEESSESGSISSPPDRLWRTLVADRGPDGGNAKSYYPSMFKYAAEHSTEGGGLQTSVLSTREHPLLKEFLHRMKAVVWNRRLFKSAREGLLGLAPKAAKEGDRICILKGCSVPVVLHPIQDHYSFVGECYLHTMMDGKAMDRQDELKLPTKIFEIQ